MPSIFKFIFILSSFVFVACDGKKDDSSSNNREKSPGNPIENDTDGDPSSEGDTSKKPDNSQDLSLNTMCRIDESDGKEYCLNARDDMPSDTDPEKKIPRCKSGLLDNDECKSISIAVGKGFASLFAGETKRAHATSSFTNDTGELLDAPESAFSFDRLEFSIDNHSFRYSYPTKYDRNSADDFAEYFIGSDRFNLTIQERMVEALPISISYFGVTFNTGETSAMAFSRICSDISLAYPQSDFLVMKRNQEDEAIKYTCEPEYSNEPSIIARCDANSQHCRITAARLHFIDQSWYVPESDAEDT